MPNWFCIKQKIPEGAKVLSAYSFHKFTSDYVYFQGDPPDENILMDTELRYMSNLYENGYTSIASIPQYIFDEYYSKNQMIFFDGEVDITTDYGEDTLYILFGDVFWIGGELEIHGFGLKIQGRVGVFGIGTGAGFIPLSDEFQINDGMLSVAFKYNPDILAFYLNGTLIAEISISELSSDFVIVFIKGSESYQPGITYRLRNIGIIKLTNE